MQCRRQLECARRRVRSYTSAMHHPVLDSGLVGDLGLALDIMGAFFLAQSFVVKQLEEVVRETGSYYGANPFALRSACYSRVEARVGLFFLALGFTGQFVADTRAFQPGPGSYWWTVILGGTALLGATWALTRARCRALSRRLVSVQAYQGILQVLDMRFGSYPDVELRPQHWGTALDCDRLVGEDDYAYFIRLKRLSGYWCGRYAVLMRRQPRII